MNKQPYSVPTGWWEPRISPLWFRFFRKMRASTLREEQRMREFHFDGVERLQGLLQEGVGVLLTPNHSFHYDSYCIFHLADQVDTPFHILTAWQVFEMSSRLERWMMQRHGCFSIDREGVDMRAFRKAIEILRDSAHPLVVFPEGDIYHTNDRIKPFREGAAAIALSASRKAERRVVCVPVAMKCRYVSDPTPQLVKKMDELETRLLWRPRPDLPLLDRIYRFATGLMALKEVEHLGAPLRGPLNRRLVELADRMLTTLESQHSVPAKNHGVPERVKELRHCIIQKLQAADLSAADREPLCRAMDELFFVVQLFSYPGDYVAANPTIERLAETIDKFEEDVLDAPLPSVKGDRHVHIKLGDPVEVPKVRGGDDAVNQLTRELEGRVQGLLDTIQGSPVTP